MKLTYVPSDEAAAARPSVALVGKGITFDSGGLSIKTGDGMMTMKCDMGGAAAVIGAMCALPALGVGVPVTSYTPMTDNMTGPDATRPGDVMTARNGKTVEILNTDAEGRLVLADALVARFARTAMPPSSISPRSPVPAWWRSAIRSPASWAATTTSSTRSTARRIAPARSCGTCRCPTEYRKLLDSPIADMKNIGGRFGGTLTAGLFLKEFVADDIPWVHLDIAGPAFTESAEAEIPRGGTGFGVRTLIDWLEHRAAEHDIAELETAELETAEADSE